jgi:hypothetical protein
MISTHAYYSWVVPLVWAASQLGAHPTIAVVETHCVQTSGGTKFDDTLAPFA